MHRRVLVAAALALFATACGDDPPPDPGAATPNTPATTPTPATPTPYQAGPLATAAAASVLAATAATALARLQTHGADGARALIAQAATTTDLAAQGDAPLLLARLGPTAIPGITAALQNGTLPERRIAIAALLQLGRDAAPAADALAAARSDPDPHVRAAAEHAWKHATGDTSDLDRLNAEQAAAEARAAGR